MSTTIDANAMNPADLAALNGTAAIAEPNALSPETTDLAAKLEDPEQSRGFLRRNWGKLTATAVGVLAAIGLAVRHPAARRAVERAVEAAANTGGKAKKVRAYATGLFTNSPNMEKLVKGAEKVADVAAAAVPPAAETAASAASKVAEEAAPAVGAGAPAVEAGASKVGLKERAVKAWHALRGR